MKKRRGAERQRKPDTKVGIFRECKPLKNVFLANRGECANFVTAPALQLCPGH